MLRLHFLYQTITVYGPTFQTVPVCNCRATTKSYNPNKAGTSLVWALSRSLATTGEITFVFSSSCY